MSRTPIPDMFPPPGSSRRLSGNRSRVLEAALSTPPVFGVSERQPPRERNANTQRKPKFNAAHETASAQLDARNLFVWSLFQCICSYAISWVFAILLLIGVYAVSGTVARVIAGILAVCAFIVGVLPGILSFMLPYCLSETGTDRFINGILCHDKAKQAALRKFRVDHPFQAVFWLCIPAFLISFPIAQSPIADHPKFWCIFAVWLLVALSFAASCTNFTPNGRGLGRNFFTVLMLWIASLSLNGAMWQNCELESYEIVCAVINFLCVVLSWLDSYFAVRTATPVATRTWNICSILCMCGILPLFALSFLGQQTGIDSVVRSSLMLAVFAVTTLVFVVMSVCNLAQQSHVSCSSRTLSPKRGKNTPKDRGSCVCLDLCKFLGRLLSSVLFLVAWFLLLMFIVIPHYEPWKVAMIALCSWWAVVGFWATCLLPQSFVYYCGAGSGCRTRQPHHAIPKGDVGTSDTIPLISVDSGTDKHKSTVYYY